MPGSRICEAGSGIWEPGFEDAMIWDLKSRIRGCQDLGARIWDLEARIQEPGCQDHLVPRFDDKSDGISL